MNRKALIRMALFNLVLIATLVLVLLLQKRGAEKDPADQEQEVRTDVKP